MAWVVEQSVESGITTGNTITLASWTPVAGEIVAVVLGQRNEAISASISGNGQTWNLVADVDNDQGQNGLVMWAAVISSPTTGSITITITGNTTPADAIAARFSFSGSTLALGASASDNGPSSGEGDNANMLVALVTTQADSLIVAGGTHRNADFTVPGGQTGIDINNLYGTAGDATKTSLWYRVATSATSYNLGGSGSLGAATDWVVIAQELKQTPVASGHPAMRRLGRQPHRPIEVGRKSQGGVWYVGSPVPALARAA